MIKETSIVGKLLNRQKEVTAPVVNESTLQEGLTFTAINESVENVVGKLFKINSAIPVNEGEELGNDQFLFVKESTDGKLEIEVRNADNQVVGMLAASEAAFEKLVTDNSIEEVVTESVATVTEAAKGNTKSVEALAKCIAEEDYECAETALNELPEGEDVYDALVAEVARIAGVDSDEAEDMVEDFLDEVGVATEEDEDLDEKTKLVVRGGKVQRINVPLRKKRISAKQRAALAKARRKSNTASAKRNRKKSMIIRRRRFKECVELLNTAQSVIESYGIAVTDTDLDQSDNGVELSLTVESQGSAFEVNLTEMEEFFSEKFNAEVEIPDAESINETAAVLKLIVK